MEDLQNLESEVKWLDIGDDQPITLYLFNVNCE